MKCKLIDSHCHLDLYKNPLSLAKKIGRIYGYAICMTNLPSKFQAIQYTLKSYKNIRFALGLHPQEIAKHTKHEFELFSKLLDTTSYIGEIGLDFSPNWIHTAEKQIRSLEKILNMLRNKQKLISLHSRNAERYVLDLLIEKKIKAAVFHWYSGSNKILDSILQEGFFISVNPSMIKSKRGRSIISRIPKERILTETDGPFISTNNRPIEPLDIIPVLEFLSLQWNISNDNVKCRIFNNFKNLLMNA